MQGRLRKQPLAVDGNHLYGCRAGADDTDPLTLQIDSDMNVDVEQTGAEPMVFTPDVNTFEVEAPSIVDDF